ncbi:hypothetical protein DJ68_12950 [Halorubrum sp. C3]|nr:hypothetical protein DJ68_12950 [Halorubrum sp. C3]
MVVAPLSEKGLRWRGVAEMDIGGSTYQRTSQGADAFTISTEQSPLLAPWNKLLSLHDVANPLYDHTMPKSTFAPGEEIALWGHTAAHFGQYRVSGGNGEGDLTVNVPDGTTLLRVEDSGNVKLSDGASNVSVEGPILT